MKSTAVSDGFILRLELGEELVASLEQFCQEQKVTGAWVNGVGGVTQALVGYYHLKRRKYVFRHVKSAVELVSLQGNVSTVGDQTVLHLHAVVSDNRNKTYGGHLKEARVGGTCELYIRTFENGLTRELDPKIGLPLLNL